MSDLRFRVRRLAVIDLHGLSGSNVRLWLVRIEFGIATLIAAGLGFLFVHAGQIQGTVLGVIAFGIAANYFVLVIWAVKLRRPRLASEFAAHDVHADGRSYSLGQLRLVVPFLFLGLAARPCERVV